LAPTNNTGFFTRTQLASLGAVLPQLQPAPSDQVGLGWLRTLDVSVSWPYKIRESLTIEPMVSFFNVFNLANFDAPGNTLSGILDGTPGSANGTTELEWGQAYSRWARRGRSSLA
jgi:hypothetical protein